MNQSIEYKILRRMKYLSDQQGIVERYLEEHEGWKLHLENTRSFILDCVKKYSPKTVVVMGSGWLLDVPLKELMEICERIYLADIWHPRQIRAMVQKYPNCILVYDDLTGGAVKQVYKLVKSFRKTGIREPIGSISCNTPEFPEIVSNSKNQVVATKKPVYTELPEGKRRMEWKWTFDQGGAFNKGNRTEFNVIAIEL
jgi:hypothetical protein